MAILSLHLVLRKSFSREMGCSAMPRNAEVDFAHLPGSGFLHHVNTEGWSGKRLRLSALRHPHPRSSVPLPPVRSEKNRGIGNFLTSGSLESHWFLRLRLWKKSGKSWAFSFSCVIMFWMIKDAGHTDGKCAVVKGNQNREVTEYDRKNENQKKAPSLDALDRTGARNSRGSLWNVSW